MTTEKTNIIVNGIKFNIQDLESIYDYADFVLISYKTAGEMGGIWQQNTSQYYIKEIGKLQQARIVDNQLDVIEMNDQAEIKADLTHHFTGFNLN